jgi:putative tricarboxylic transport membrane protein
MGVAALGGFVFILAGDTASPAPWGPALMPRIVGAGLALLGGATAIAAIRSPAADAETGVDDWRGFAWTLASLALFAALIKPLGFPLAAAALFAAVARGLGSLRPARDGALGFALALAAYAIFALGLGLPLSWGGMIEAGLKAR